MKITKFYLDKAKYKAFDSNGNSTILEIDYWNNDFKMSKRNKDLDQIARNLLSKKHRVNFAGKLLK